MQIMMVSLRANIEIFGKGSIFPLTLAFFYKYWPELLKHERVFFVKTPEYISTNGKETVWHYTDDEYRAHDFNGKGWSHRHIKGLGSLTEAEYRECIQNPTLDKVVLPENAHELFDMLFNDKRADDRKQWVGV